MPHNETEIKLRVSSHRKVKRHLADVGFVVKERRHFERNFLFDFPDSQLRKSSSVIRLRREGKLAASLSLKIRYENFETISASFTSPTKTILWVADKCSATAAKPSGFQRLLEVVLDDSTGEIVVVFVVHL